LHNSGPYLRLGNVSPTEDLPDPRPMILYNHKSWWGALTHKHNVLSDLKSVLIVQTIWSIIAYYICLAHGLEFDTRGQQIIGCFTTFLVIFRAQQSYARYLAGKMAISQLSHTSRDIMSFAICNMRGLHSDDAATHQKAVEAITSVTRLVIGYMVSILIYTRIGWYSMVHKHIGHSTKQALDIDRARLRAVLTEKEFTFLDHLLGCQEATLLSQRDNAGQLTAQGESDRTRPPLNQDLLGAYRAINTDPSATAGSTVWSHDPDTGFVESCIESSSWPHPRPVREDTRSTSESLPLPSALDFLLRHKDPCDFRVGKPVLPIKHHGSNKDQDFCDVQELNETNLPVVLGSWIRQVFTIQGGESHGWVERLVSIADIRVADLLRCYQRIHACITMPFPIGYSQICKLLLILFSGGCPFVIDTTLGLAANVYFPVLVALACFGLESTAVELEQPFGDSPNSLNMVDLVRQLEHECITLLNAHHLDHIVQKEFCLLPLPRHASEKGWFLCLNSNRTAVLAMLDGISTDSINGIVSEE